MTTATVEPTTPAGEPAPGPLLPPEQPTPPPQPEPVPPSEYAPDGGNLPDRTPDDEPTRDDYPLSVWEAIAEVTRLIGAVAKTGQTTGGERFAFRGIDDLLLALHPVLADVGLVLLPGVVVERERETRATRNGGALNVCHLRVRYTLVGPDGSMMTGEAWGEAGDSGDKATQKAASQSYKTFVFQTFSIPTQDSARDEPDAVHDIAAPHDPAVVDRALAAWAAARDAATYDRLAAIRQGALAEGLLGVPVGPDGTVLGVLLDQRRTEVDRAAAAQAPA